MKRITAFIMALLMGLFIMMNNCFKADAALMSSSLLAYLLQACAEILVGSGTVTQSQFNSMSTSEIFDTTKAAAPNIDFSALPKDPFTSLNLFLMQNLPKAAAPVYALEDFAFRKFIMDEKFNLPTVNPELKGFGASCKVTLNSTGLVQLITFGSYGIIYNPGGSGTRTCELQPGDGLVKRISFQNDTSTETTFDSRKVGGYLGDESRTVQLIGDWRYVDGTPATDLITFVDEVPEAIGTVDIDDATYDVNGDGTVTIDDKTYTINDDGSVTVDDKTYYPDYDISPYNHDALLDLLLRLLNNIDVVDDVTDDLTDDILDDVEAPAIGIDALDSMILPKTIFTVFPFCLPRDFVRGMQLFSAKPETPHFECEIKVPAFLNIPAQTWNIVIDLERFETLARITRWLSFISFSFLLIQLSATIVKGAH